MSSRPDIALFLPALEGGGAERVLLDLAAEFVRRDLRVDLVVAAWRGDLVSEVPPDVRQINLNTSRTLLALPGLTRYLRSASPKALLSTMGHANVVASFASWLAGGRSRTVLREAIHISTDLSASNVSTMLLKVLMRWAYWNADGVVAVSQGVASDIIDRKFATKEKVHVINNPSVTPRLLASRSIVPDHPWFQAEESLPTPVICTVGRLSPQKDHRTLLHAFALVREATECRLLILGDGALRQDLTDLVLHLGVEDDVDFLGFVQDPFPFIRASRLFVLSSRYEGLPNVLIQALALGTPVVSTDCPSGPREILQGGELGTLVPVGDSEALAKAILAALASERPPPSEDWLTQYSIGPVTTQYLRVLGVAES